MGIDTEGLCRAITTTHDDARAKCTSIQGKDVVAIIGCTGSGKTTVSLYAQGSDFNFVGGKLKQKESTGGSDVGDQRQSATRGLRVAEQPVGPGLWLVDLAGTGDTAGSAAELCGAVYRSSVLQAASSVRVALVMSLDRVGMGNERGKGMVRDLEHVAGLFRDVKASLGSVGMIVTSGPDILVEPSPAARVLQTVADALKGLEETAVPASGESFDELHGWEDVQKRRMEITPAGLELLQYLSQHCDRACETLDQVKEGVDEDLLARLVLDSCAVLPINVLRADQRDLVGRFLGCLKPVKEPTSAMTYTLPGECRRDLAAALDREAAQAKRQLGTRGMEWAADATLVDAVLSFLQLAMVVDSMRLLEWAHSVSEDLCALLVSQNKSACAGLSEGVALGNLPKVEGALEALAAMDQFRKTLSARMPTVKLLEWSSLRSATSDAVEQVNKECVRLLPEGLSEVKWDAALADRSLSILRAAEKLGCPGLEFVDGWMKKLATHVLGLKASAAACADVISVVRALTQLDECRRFLPSIVEFLEGCGCKLPFGDNLAAVLEEAKAAVKAALSERSRSMVEAKRASSRSSACQESLGLFCRSTELNAIFGEDLVDVFLMKPLSSILVPTQDEINSIAGMLQDPSDQWCTFLAHLAQRVEDAGELGPKMISAAGLEFGHLLDTVAQRVEQEAATLQKAIHQLGESGAPKRGSAVAMSVCSGEWGRLDAMDCDLPEDPEVGEEVEAALARLKDLLPADSLLPLVDRTNTGSAYMALYGFAWALNRTMKSLLKKAKKEMMSWTCATTLDCKALWAMAKLAACLPLSESISEGLATIAFPAIKGTRSALQQVTEEATSFVQEVVQEELSEWTKAEAGKEGWLPVFQRHVQQSRRLKCVAPLQVWPAYHALVQKVVQWRDGCLAKARQASEQDEAWPVFIDCAVRQGLAFEESTLSAALELEGEDFRGLVERQALMWQRTVEEAPNTTSPALGRKLRELATALEHLPQFARDTRTLQLRNGLASPLERLDAVLSESQLRFQKALQEERYPEACQWLSGIQDSQRHRELLSEELGRVVEETLEHLSVNADDEDVLRAARKARSLVQSCERLTPTLPDQELAARVGAQVAKLRQGLEARKADATEHLQWALDGRGSPSRTLSILAALGGSSKVVAAEEALLAFISTKRKELPDMICEDLMTWIIRQDSLLRSSSMPEELQGNRVVYGDLIKDFMKRFTAAFKGDLDELERCKDRKDWATVKQTSERLRDMIENVFELEVLKSEKTQLRALKRRLGVGNDGALGQAKEEVKRGSFFLAIRALVAGDGSKAEQELCEVISAELAKNMNFQDADGASLQKRLSVLESFLLEAGSNPPDELKSYSREVREVCERLRPQLASAARAAVEESLTAASGGETELLRMVKALARVKNFEGALSGEEQGNVKLKLDEFFGRLKRVVEKVADDIKTLQVSSLSLSLEPVRHWLQDFALLSHTEKQVLMEALHSRHCDLKDWLQGELAKPLEDVVDSRTIENEADSMSFAQISLRCKVAGKLSLLVENPKVNLNPLEERVLRHREGGLLAIKRSGLADFNKHYKVLKSASADLPELTAASRCLAELCDALQTDVLEPLGRSIETAKEVHDAVGPIMELRSRANEAPDTYEDVLSRLQSGLSGLQRRMACSPETINAIGGRLGQSSIGQLVLAEFPEIFGAAKDMQNNAVFRRAGETGDPKEVVGRLTEASGLGSEEYWELECALAWHEGKSEELKDKYFLQSSSFDDAKAKAKEDLEAVVARATVASNAESKADTGRTLLTHLAVCYSVIKCGKEFMAAPLMEKKHFFVAPHRAQMLSIFRLLHTHKMGSVSIWSWLLSMTGCAGTARGKAPENHLAEVLTGEGKCLTLGLLAAFLALQGVDSDLVCYRKILTVQDWGAMLPFYEFVGVQDKLRYVTFDELCAERLEAIKSAAERLLRPEGLEADQTVQRLDISRRALLIDEVDVFFGRGFYGQTWDGGFKLKSPEAAALVRFMFEEKRHGRQVTDFASTSTFQNLLQQVPSEMHSSIHFAARALSQNLEEWSKPEPVLDPESGRIGYKDKDEIDYNLSYANKTVFAYLSFELEGKLSAKQAEEHVGIDLFCGRFSFAELPKEYCCILGVTGTLRELLCIPGIQSLLKEEYGFKHFTCTPSIFGERRLVFKPAEHINILNNEPDWHSRIESEVGDHKRRGNAVLVFFKNEGLLRQFPSWKSYETLTERTDPRRRNGYIAAATTAGQVTLLTRAFGRGIDFQMPSEGHEVVVLQTFLSSLVSEETQIKGRTARQGKSGHYRLILCAEHLEAKMGFHPADVQVLRSGRGDEIQLLLHGKQRAKTLSKVAGLKQRKEKAAALERETEAWEQLLFDPAESTSTKLKKLAAWNAGESSWTHYTVLLDNSGSMRGRPWEELTAAFQSFRAELLRDPAVAATTLVSVSVFNREAHTLTPSHARPAQVQDIGHLQTGGGTNFAAAFAKAHRLIARSPPQAKETILFLTDGEAAMPVREIQALIADHGKRIGALTCVAFGAGAGLAVLQQIGALFQAAQIPCVFRTPQNQASLVQTFVEAAGSRTIHYGGLRGR